MDEENLQEEFKTVLNKWMQEYTETIIDSKLKFSLKNSNYILQIGSEHMFLAFFRQTGLFRQKKISSLLKAFFRRNR